MPKPNPIRRIDFDDEFLRMMSAICTALLETGSNRLDIFASVIQDKAYLTTYYPETRHADINNHIKRLTTAYPPSRDSAPMYLELERNVTASAGHEIGKLCTEYGYKRDERKRIAIMFSGLLRDHLKADDALVDAMAAMIMADD